MPKLALRSKKTLVSTRTLPLPCRSGLTVFSNPDVTVACREFDSPATASDPALDTPRAPSLSHLHREIGLEVPIRDVRLDHPREVGWNPQLDGAVAGAELHILGAPQCRHVDFDTAVPRARRDGTGRRRYRDVAVTGASFDFTARTLDIQVTVAGRGVYTAGCSDDRDFPVPRARPDLRAGVSNFHSSIAGSCNEVDTPWQLDNETHAP